MTKWWLISNEDIEIIRKGLNASTHEANDYNCNPMPHESCAGCDGDEMRDKAWYTLDTGLHTTNVVPTDYIVELEESK